MKDNHQQSATRVQRIVAAVLTIIFIPTIFGFCFAGVLEDPEALWKSIKYRKAKNFLADPEDNSFFPMLAARIASLQEKLNEYVPLKQEMGEINATFQYALGKNMLVQGDNQVLRLDNGQLYYMTEVPSLAEEANTVLELNEALKDRVPMLFAYVQPGFYNDGIPIGDGYGTIDTAEELAEEVLGIVRSGGIETLDSREYLSGLGYTQDDLFFKTDKHWTALAALLATQVYAEKINEMTGTNLDLDRLQLDQFETEFYDDFMMGTYGEPLGLHNCPAEDVTLYIPTFETDITRHSVSQGGNLQDESGPFTTSVVRRHELEIDEELGLNKLAYRAYGVTEQLDVLTNNREDCEDITILMLRDSFSTPICSFLSLVAKEVVSSDLRYGHQNALELVETYDPDIVIVSYSRMMLETYGFNFGLNGVNNYDPNA